MLNRNLGLLFPWNPWFLVLLIKREKCGRKHSSSWASPAGTWGSHLRALAPEQSPDSSILSPAMIKHSCQPMQPGKIIKTKHAVYPSPLGATAEFHSPLPKKKERDSLHRHLHGQQTHLVTSHITVRKICWHQMKAKAFPDQTIKVWQLSCGGCQRDSEYFGRNSGFF